MKTVEEIAKGIFLKNYGLKAVMATKLSKKVAKISGEDYDKDEIKVACRQIFEPYNDVNV